MIEMLYQLEIVFKFEFKNLACSTYPKLRRMKMTKTQLSVWQNISLNTKRKDSARFLG